MSEFDAVKAASQLVSRSKASTKTFKDSLLLMRICKEDAEEMELGEAAAIALFNARVPEVMQRKDA